MPREQIPAALLAEVEPTGLAAPEIESVATEELKLDLHIPEPEVLARSYRYVEKDLHLDLPAGTNLGQALGRLQTRPSHFVRIGYGLYPYEKPHSPTDVAKLFGLTYNAAYKGVSQAKRALQREAARLTPEAARDVISLEDAAHLLQEYGGRLEKDKLNIILASCGLPPNSLPVLNVHLAAERGVPRQAVDAIVRDTLIDLRNEKLQPSLDLLDTLPDDEAVRAQYDKVAAELGITLPQGVTLGHSLSMLERRPEHLLRAQFGMYPYSRRHSLWEIAGSQKTTIHSLRQSCSVAANKLKKMSDTPVPIGMTSLEEIARNMDEHPERIAPDMQDTIRAIRGLSPYNWPVPHIERARLRGVGIDVISRSERAAVAQLCRLPQPTIRKSGSRRAAARLLNVQEGAPEESEAIPLYDDQERMVQTYRRMEAGWYAGSLLSLRGDTAAGTEDLAASLEVLAKRRARYGKSGVGIGSRSPFPAGSRPTGKVVDARPLQARRAFNPTLDTEGGRERTIKRLQYRANQITDEEVPLLRKIAEDGALAEDELVKANLGLALFVSGHYRGGSYNLSAAIEGLHVAVQRYDIELGYRFSTYATNWIAQRVNRSVLQEFSEQLGVTKTHVREIWQMRRKESELTNTLRRTPTVEELAVAAELTPERVTENRTIYRNRQAMRTQWEDKGKATPVAASTDPTAVARSAEAETELREGMQSAFAKAFAAVGLSGEQQTILCGLYGLPPFETGLNDEEMAAHLDVSTRALGKLRSSALKKLRNSPEALSAMYEYLRHGNEPDED
jgi:DNA-directed RNA polymerase sigma subunit (sigma70/sigma32)